MPAQGFYIVENGLVTHHNATGTHSKELLHAAHIIVTELGCPFRDCEHRDTGCAKPQLMHCMLVHLQRQAEKPMCRVCGCTEDSPCGCDGQDLLLGGLIRGCSWVEADLCSSCVGYENVTGSVSRLAELEEVMQVKVG